MATVQVLSRFVQHNVLETKWVMTGADTGTPENLSRYPVHSIQISGTFGGATALVEGSDDNITYFTLTGENPAGGADSLVSTTSNQRWDVPNVVPQFIRARTSGGTGSAINVIITSRGYGH